MTRNFGMKSASAPPDAWLKGTLLYQHWEQMKRQIGEHKWYESEKAGYDIGWERASVDWMIRYGRRRMNTRDL